MQNKNWHVVQVNEYGNWNDLVFGDYTVLYNDTNTYQPYVVAYKYNKSDNTWAQGHYFSSLRDAMVYACAAMHEIN